MELIIITKKTGKNTLGSLTQTLGKKGKENNLQEFRLTHLQASQLGRERELKGGTPPASAGPAGACCTWRPKLRGCNLQNAASFRRHGYSRNPGVRKLKLREEIEKYDTLVPPRSKQVI